MEEKPFQKYFQDERQEKISQKLFFTFLMILLVFYAIIFGVISYYRTNFEYVTINGVSMQPTLNVNVSSGTNDSHDGVYIKRTNKVDYNDIIVIATGYKDESIIKRALAFGGDYITIASVNYDGERDYRFMRVKKGSDEVEIINEKNYIKSYDAWNGNTGTIINNVEYENPFYTYYTESDLNYDKKIFTVNLDGQDRDVIFFKIPDNKVFFMGDNRTQSRDARVSGATDKKNVLGYVVRIVKNGTMIKKDAGKWFSQSLEDFFSIIWREISIFFGSKG